MKIAITGGAGFIGAQLTRAYLDAGHDVFVIDNLCYGSQQAVDPRARFYRLDVRDSRLRTILMRERPDLVSHHAACWRRDRPFERSLMDADVHIRGLLNVLDSCVDASVRKVIFASGGNDLYAPATSVRPPLSEDTPLHPRRPIDISRAAGEWYIRHYTLNYSLKHTILRYADVYGETEHSISSGTVHPVSYFIAMLARQRRPIIRGSGEEKRDHIFIDDVVRANLYALKLGDNQTLHISSGQGHTPNQLYEMVSTLLESTLQSLYIANSSTPGPIELDNTRAQRVLGWQPAVSVSEGILRMVTQLCRPQKRITDPSIECVQVEVEAKAAEALAT